MINKDWLENELKINGFIKTDFGKKLLDLSEEMNTITKGDQAMQEKLAAFLTRAVKGLPLSPITLEDDWEPSEEGFRNKRYSPIYRSVDGIIRDDNATVWVDPKQNNIYVDHRSSSEVILPYYPEPKYVVDVEKKTD